MDTFTILQIFGWINIGILLFLVLATMCMDLGGGFLSRFVGKTDSERRVIINIIAPTWDGNQVWLVAAGGAFFAIVPRVYAASFSGMYFGFLLLLFCLFLRPISFEYRHLMTTQKQRNGWDLALCLGSILPLIIMGLVVGNLFLGFPMAFDPDTLRFFYGYQGTTGSGSATMALIYLFHPFALTVAILTAIIGIFQGATYCLWRAEGVLAQRFRKICLVSGVLFLILFVFIGICLVFMNGYIYTPSPEWKNLSDAVQEPLTGAVVSTQVGGWYTNYLNNPWMFIAPLLVIFGIIYTITNITKDKLARAMTCSTIACLGCILTLGFALFPFLMVSSTNPNQSLVLWNSTSSQLSLTGVLVASYILIPIILYYTTFIYRKMWGRDRKLSVEEVERKKYELY